MRTDDGAEVDIIPATSELLAAGELIWPSGRAFNLTGVRLAIGRAERVRVAEDLTVDVAPLPVITLLKMIAYLDRPDRLADLGDIAQAFDAVTDEDRYDDRAIDLGLDFNSEAGPFVLARRLLPLEPRELAAARRFVELVRDDGHALGTQAAMARRAPANWRDDPDQLLERVEAFARGLEL